MNLRHVASVALTLFVFGATLHVAAPARALVCGSLPRLDALTLTSTAIAVARVERIEEIVGWRQIPSIADGCFKLEGIGQAQPTDVTLKVAVATVIRPFKGLHAGQSFAFLAERRNGYDGHGTVGETSLLFLASQYTDKTKYRNFFGGDTDPYPQFREELKKTLPGIPLFRVAWSGWGWSEIYVHEGKEYLKALNPIAKGNDKWSAYDSGITGLPSTNAIRDPQTETVKGMVAGTDIPIEYERFLLPLTDTELEITRLLTTKPKRKLNRN